MYALQATIARWIESHVGAYATTVKQTTLTPTLYIVSMGTCTSLWWSRSLITLYVRAHFLRSYSAALLWLEKSSHRSNILACRDWSGILFFESFIAFFRKANELAVPSAEPLDRESQAWGRMACSIFLTHGDAAYCAILWCHCLCLQSS